MDGQSAEGLEQGFVEVVGYIHLQRTPAIRLDHCSLVSGRSLDPYPAATARHHLHLTESW